MLQLHTLIRLIAEQYIQLNSTHNQIYHMEKMEEIMEYRIGTYHVTSLTIISAFIDDFIHVVQEVVPFENDYSLPVYSNCCASRCACVWLWRHGSSLRGNSVWMSLLFEICILLCQMNKTIQKWTSMKLWTRICNLIFRIPFTLSIWLSFYIRL